MVSSPTPPAFAVRAAGAALIAALCYCGPLAAQVADDTARSTAHVDSTGIAPGGETQPDTTVAGSARPAGSQLSGASASDPAPAESPERKAAREAEERERAESSWFNPYTVTIGGSFDLLDGVSVTDLYANVNVFLPNLYRPTPATALGFDAGLIRARTISKEDTLRVERASRFYDAAEDSLVIRIDEARLVRETEVEYLSLYFDGLYRFNEYLSAILPHVEVRRREIRTEFDYMADTSATRFLTFADTVYTGPSIPFGTAPRPFEDRAFRRSEYGGYFGAGLLLASADSDFGVAYRLRGVTGLTDGGHGFYLVQFLLHERSLGLRLGGEIQGLFKAEGNEPVISVFLAKAFSLRRLADFIGK